MTILEDKLRQITKYCMEQLNEDDVHKGYPTWDEQHRKGLPPIPGVGKATWCNRYTGRILEHFGYDVSLLYNDNPSTHKPSLGWTTANAMVRNSRKNADAGKIKRLSEEEAVQYANAGEIPYACWYNKKGSGHIAIVSSGKYDPVLGAPLFNAGWENGYFHRKEKEAFGKLEPVEFYLLPKKE